MATKVLNLSDITLTDGEVRVLTLGLSFCPTPKANVVELERDIFQFVRKVRLKYHFANMDTGEIPETPPTESLIKLPSNFTPKRRVHQELERILEPIEKMKIVKLDTKTDNLSGDRAALQTLIEKTRDNSIVIKPADKGDIVVIQTGQDYYTMCMKHLTDKEYYKQLGFANPSKIVEKKVMEFANKYRTMMTRKEYEFLTYSEHSMSNFYMLPKLHKNAELNDFIKNMESPSEYLNIKLNSEIEGRPIVSGPNYYTSGISKMLHHILKPCMEKVKHILKDTFDFIERFDKVADEETQIITWDIKSLYPNIRHELFFEAINYWVDRLGCEIPSRFSKQFILDGLHIILKYNYVYFDKNYYHQIKGTATGTNFAVVGANLVVGFKEVKMFPLLTEIYPRNFVEWLITNYFRFLDDVCHKWLKTFDLEMFSKALNGMDADLQFIMDEIRDESHYLDVSMKKADGVIRFDIYHKPTNSFSYLRYSSCHPPHTIKNIALSLGKRIVRIVSDNIDERLEEMKNHLIQRDHPKAVVEKALAKLYQPKQRVESDEKIVFVSTYNPQLSYNRKIIKETFHRSKHYKIKSTFGETSIIQAYKQPNNLRKILTRAKFERIPRKVYRKPNGLFPCGSCTYCQRGYVEHRTEFEIFNGDVKQKWVYNRHFTCNSVNVLYIARTKNHPGFYLGRTKSVKTRLSKHISDVHHSENTTCKEFIQHVIDKSEMKEPFFEFMPFYYEDDFDLRDFMEKRFIMRFRPTLNGLNV